MRKCSLCNNKHEAKGLCKKHYLKAYRDDPKNRKRAIQQKHDWYEKNKDLEVMKLKREQRNFSGKRETVLARDNYTCQLCGHTKQLVVHHKNGKGRSVDNPDNRTSNLITLCKACHLQVHFPELLQAKMSRRRRLKI